MAVAMLLMDAETIYNLSNEFLNANAPPSALEGYRFVAQLMPDLASAYHQMGLSYAVQPSLLPVFSCTEKLLNAGFS